MDLAKYEELFREIAELPLTERVEALNAVRLRLHEVSPFRDEPVDCVLWTAADDVVANDYNPNKVAPPEMELLEVSIVNDGYTQPIVTWKNGEKKEVVDGFHRNRVGKESKLVKARVQGYLPTVVIGDKQSDKSDRIASTIRHNRARGKHQVSAMSEIVLELKARNWTNEHITKELGMDQDEILRLCQITGLASLFSGEEFSKAWSIDDAELNCVETTDLRSEAEVPAQKDRIFHTYDKWECYKGGFYAQENRAGHSEQIYADFLSNLAWFRAGLEAVISEWKHSCEHYLTNSAMNRIAWLGQAAACRLLGISNEFRAGYQLLSDEKKLAADQLAHEYLNKWLVANSRAAVSFEDEFGR